MAFISTERDIAESPNDSQDALTASHLCKSFGPARVVDDISFSVAQGEVFGLIGPNGAGKTTTIRMLMNILHPESGEVLFFGQPLNQDALEQIGYLPEERGLYKNSRVRDVLAYLGQLKGLSSENARSRADEVLTQLGMQEHASKKVSELSRGLGQIVQFCATIVHEPRLVILDEPFSGLDPVNTEHLKQMVIDLKRRGTVVIFSTHQMNDVEELCDRVFMIDKGRAVLYGGVTEVRQRYRSNSVFVRWDGPLNEVRGVSRWEDRGQFHEAFLEDGVVPEDVLKEMLRLGGSISMFQLSTPRLHDIFLRIVRDGAIV